MAVDVIVDAQKLARHSVQHFDLFLFALCIDAMQNTQDFYVFAMVIDIHAAVVLLPRSRFGPLEPVKGTIGIGWSRHSQNRQHQTSSQYGEPVDSLHPTHRLH